VTNTSFQIDWTPAETGQYYLVVSADADGFYRVSFDDGTPQYADVEFWISGLAYDAGGSVTLGGSSMFQNNSLAGIIGWNGGAVALSNVAVWGNGTEGIYVDNTAGAGNVTLSGMNYSGGNGWEGLRLETNGIVSLANLNLFNNGLDGVYLRAHGTGKAVTLLNIISTENGLMGLNIATYGLTTLNNVRAWYNGEDGAEVQTEGYNLTVLNSTFMCNARHGLAYWKYDLPFVFTNLNNTFLGNGDTNLKEY